MKKEEVYKARHEKLKEIFAVVEQEKQELVEGLIDDAAFLYAENTVLKESLMETGMIKIHPQYKDVQKPVPASTQYLKNLNSYAVVIKTLNGVLSKADLDDVEDLSDYE